MTRSSKGMRTGTRKRLKAGVRAKFKPEKFLKEFKPGDKVIINPDPSSQKGLPYPKFKGRVGTVGSRRGNAYLVDVRVGKKIKCVIARPEHMKAL